MKRVLAVAVLVGLLSAPSCASSNHSPIDYYVASLVSDAESLQIEDHQTQPDRFDVANGNVPIVRTALPLVEVPASQIAEARVYQVKGHGGGAPETWAVVRLLLTEEYRARVDQLYSRYADHYLLLGLNESLVDMEPLGVYPSEGFPGGVFRSLKEARDAYAHVGVGLSVVTSLPAATRENERFEREYRSAALWFAKCDPETFDELRKRKIEKFIGPVAAQEESLQIDCDRAPPRFPPAPPGRPEVCTEASEKGNYEAGERTGVWSIANPYDQEIRLDFYRNGQLVRAVWLRDCGERNQNASTSTRPAGVPAGER